MGAVMKPELSLMFLAFGLGMLAADIREQASNNNAKKASDNAITMKYVKDQNGNCYASGPTVHEFSWIPCELTK